MSAAHRRVLGRIPEGKEPLLGRDDELGWISQALDEEGLAVLVSPAPGGGLRRLAAEWARAQGDAYGLLAWLEGDALRFHLGLKELASQLGIPGEHPTTGALSDAVAQGLAALGEPWVLVVHGGRADAVSPLLGRGGHLVVIADGGGWPEDAVVPISPLDQAGAEALLARGAGQARGEALWELAGAVGGGPLALRIVGALLAGSKLSPQAMEAAIEARARLGAGDKEAEEGPRAADEAPSDIEAWAYRYAERQAVGEPGVHRGLSPALNAAVLLAAERAEARWPGALGLLERAAPAGGLPVPAALLEPIPPGAVQGLEALHLARLEGEGLRLPEGVAQAIWGATPRRRRVEILDALCRGAEGLLRGDPSPGPVLHGAALAHAAHGGGADREALIPLHRALADAHRRLGLYDEARRFGEAGLSLARQRAPDGDALVASLLLSLADVYEDAGEPAEALYHLQDAAALIEAEASEEEARLIPLNQRREALLGALLRQLELNGPGHHDH